MPGGENHSAAFAVNNLGQIVGISNTADGDRAFLWQNGVMTNLGVLNPSDVYSVAQDINDNGYIVGESYGSAFLYYAGTMNNLGTLGGSYAAAGGINNLGQVVGISSDANGVTNAFLWSNGTMIDIDPIVGGYSRAGEINDLGQITGFFAVPSGPDRGFIWQNGDEELTDLGALFGEPGYTTAFDINNNGQIVGYSGIVGVPEHYPFIWQNGVMTDLGYLSGGSRTAGYARGINDLGQVVGMSGSSGFIWTEDGGMLDLNDLVDDSAIGWRLTHPYDINELGQIVGMGTTPDGKAHAFLLTPVPEPASIVLWTGLGLMGLLASRRRRTPTT